MIETHRLTPVINRHARADGSEYFVGWAEEMPAVIVQEATYEEALEALRREVRELGPYVGMPNAFIPSTAAEWVHGECNSLKEVQPGSYVTVTWRKERFRTDAPSRPPAPIQRTLWETAQHA